MKGNLNKVLENNFSSKDVKQYCKGTSLRDLARKSGYSISTVSKALNDSDEISKETKKVLRNLAKRFNYVPDKNASSLRKRKTNTIMVFLPKYKMVNYSSILEGIVEVSQASGYQTLIHQFSSKSAMRTLRDAASLKSVDGIVVLLSTPSGALREAHDFQFTNSVPAIRFMVTKSDFQNVISDKVLGEQICRRLLQFIDTKNEVAPRFSQV